MSKRMAAKPIDYCRTVFRFICVNDIRISKGRFNKKYHYKPSTPEETAENLLKHDFNVDKPNKNGVQISQRRRFPDLNKKYFFAQFLTFMIDIQSAMLHSDLDFQFILVSRLLRSFKFMA